ncbi:DNA adenine methylase [Ideonella dechloratans]|uniref:DNA adenine methylase n=1 Tax=Ideonella dechloratans TaxID=36863 RepID=UPI0035AE5D8C
MRYPGGKGKSFQHLINLMPPHATYIETHLGGGAVMRNKKAAQRSFGIDLDAAVIDRWRRSNPSGCTLVHGDAIEFLASFDFTGQELVYCDPPYVTATRRRARIYRHEYSDRDHERLLQMLLCLPCMVMISGYENEIYARHLAGWNRYSFDAVTQAGLRKENVWFNFEPPTRLHDAGFLGDTFRERQSIKRRHERLVDRFERMCPVERHHALQLLNAKFGVRDIAVAEATE